MIVKLPHGTYMITWKHKFPQSAKLYKQKDNGGTSCFIYRLPDSGDGLKELVSECTLKRYYKDQYSKDTGRKLSLTNCLNVGRTKKYIVEHAVDVEISPGVRIIGDRYTKNGWNEDGVFSYEDRKLIWEEYIKTTQPIMVPVDYLLEYFDPQYLLDLASYYEIPPGESVLCTLDLIIDKIQSLNKLTNDADIPSELRAISDRFLQRHRDLMETMKIDVKVESTVET